MSDKQISGSSASDKMIIMVCTLPEKPPRKPKASDKREVPQDFDPERRIPPPDPLELDNHPKLMNMLRQLAEAVEEHAFDKAIGEWEGYSSDYQRPDADDIYDDAMIDLLNDESAIVDLANDACKIDNLSSADSWDLFMIAKKHAIEDDCDTAGLSTLGERAMKLVLLGEVFRAWYDQRWDGLEKWEREEKRRSEQDHA